MSKRNKGAFMDLMPPYGVGGFVDAKAMQRHQVLAQDYEELRKEADAMSSNLELAKQRRYVLAAEVSFLRRRYKNLLKTRDANASQERLLESPSAHKQVKNKERIASRKEASRLRLPPLPTSKPRKNKSVAKVVVGNNTSPSTVLQHSDSSYCGSNGTGDDFIRSSVLNKKGRTHTSYFLPILESGSKERTYRANDAAALRRSIATFELNKVSTGDGDNQNLVEAAKFEEAKKSLVRGVNDEKQNELKFSVCRNAGGEGPTRVGKRKISWQDPVALRV